MRLARIFAVLTFAAVACTPAAPPAAAPTATRPPAAAPTTAPAAGAATASPAAAPATTRTEVQIVPSPSAGASPAAVPSPAAAAPVAARKVANSGYKDGDTINFIVPTSPGGGYDTQARLLAPYLEKALKEVTGSTVRVVVQNVPGGTQRAGTEQVARAAPDGKTIALFSGNITAGHQVVSGASYDLNKMTPLAMYPPSQRAFVIRKDVQLPERTFAGLMARSQQKPILIGQPGLEADIKIMQLLLKDAGADFKFDLVALDGSSQILAALLRGDIEAGWSTTSGLAPLVRDNPDTLEWLVNTGCSRETSAPDLQTIVEQKVPNADQICTVSGSGTRLIMGPPGIPANTAEALSESLRVAMSDPEHEARSLQASFDPTFLPPAQESQVIKTTLDTLTKFKDQLE